MNTELAACLDSDPELWFGATYSERAVAVSICHECPIRWECLEDTIRRESAGDHKYLYGVFGGLTAPQRRELIRPVCQRCETAPRPQKGRYCPTCAPLARADVLRRADQNRKVA